MLAVALNTAAFLAHGELATTLFTDGLSLLCSRVHLQVDLAEAYKLCELHQLLCIVRCGTHPAVDAE